MNGLTNAPLSQDKNQWNWIRSEDATYKLLDEKTPLSFTGDLYGSLPINCVDYVGKPSRMPASRHLWCLGHAAWGYNAIPEDEVPDILNEKPLFNYKKN